MTQLKRTEVDRARDDLSADLPLKTGKLTRPSVCLYRHAVLTILAATVPGHAAGLNAL